jgi:hypothetical protein
MFSSIDSCEHDYIENLISKGKNGTLIAGVLSYCYGMPIPMQSGMIVHQIYFPWKKNRIRGICKDASICEKSICNTD